MSLKDEASMSSNIWVLVAGAALVMLALLSQLTDTATCYKIPGCMLFRDALGPGIHGMVN
jgi:hypothetical protein